jgi:outer membrane protein insertion porin family
MLVVARVAPLWGQEQTLYQVRVDSVVVTGAFRYSEEGVRRIAGLRVGEVVNGPDVQTAIQRLFATGEFSDVQVRVTPREPNIFFIDVTERLLVGEFLFQGLEHVNDGTIRDSVGLLGGVALDPSRVATASALTRQLLAEAGFPQATVDTSIVADPSGLDQVNLIFEVHEGPRLALARVEFSGNQSFTDSQIRGSMNTSEEGFFWFRPGELHREAYRQDLSENIPNFYAQYGYIDMEVLGDTIVVDTLSGKGRIEIQVNEGPQYGIRSFDIEGNTRFPASQLAEYFPDVVEGLLGGARSDEELDEIRPPFNRGAFDEASQKIADLYRDAGYLSVNIVSEVNRVPPDNEGESPTVDILLLVQEGQPAYIRTVTIVGNDYTHDAVIRKVLLTLPGDIYSQQLLIQSIRNLQTLGFFETLPPDEAIQIKPRDDGDIDLEFRVREKQTGNVNFGISAAASTGLAGFIGYDQPNLFGQAKVGHFRWLFGRRSQDIELSYTDPEIFGTRNSLSIGVQSSRDQFQTFSLGTRRQTGGFFEFGIPIFRLRSTRFYAGYSLFNDDVSDLDGGLGQNQPGYITEGTRSTISLRLVRDTRAGGLFPVSGSRNSLAARFTGGWLGGDGDYNRWDFTSEWFAPVGQIGGSGGGVPIELVLGLAFRAGLIFGDNPFFIERYYVGGTQVGQQVRGYEEATITPRGHIPRNAPVSSLERVGESYFTTTAQFGVKLTDNIFASAFIDGGNVWEVASEFNPADLLIGAGLGVSLVTPFGPIGIDYAYGFDRRDVLGRADPGWQLHFRFGRLF